jgi:hypothetical protein
MKTLIKVEPFFLKNILFSIKMEEHDSLLDHLLKIKDIRDQLKAIDRKVEKEDLVIITIKTPLSSENCIEMLKITSNYELMFDQLSNNLL